MTDLERKLYHACLHAYQWHCGTSSEQAEKDCMEMLIRAIEAYNEEGKLDNNWCEHINREKDIPNLSIKNEWKMKKTNFSANDWNLCPICGARRPVEKSLEDKLVEQDRLYEKECLSKGTVLTRESYMNRLAFIAREHFKNGGV